jgi:hypothetical protein
MIPNRFALFVFCLSSLVAIVRLCADYPEIRDGWVTVKPPEFHGAINNPLKGFRSYKPGGYGLLERKYIRWSDIEQGAGDTVDRIIAHTNAITRVGGKPFEDLNIKLVPRVFLDWNGKIGGQEKDQHWPADLHDFDYDSPELQERLAALVARLGQAWDADPRIFAVQMGLIGHFGEHHNPAPTPAQRRLLAEAFKKAFRNKPVLVRHNDPEFMAAGFGIYYDTFANIGREPPDGPKDQFPWQATHVFPDQWKLAPIEGEVEYNWQNRRPDAMPEQTFGRTPDETMVMPAYRRFMIDKIRRYHASYLGWIDNYDPSKKDALAGAGEIQKSFGYRFVIDSVSYPASVSPGSELQVKLTVRNTGSAPFYLDWPVAVGLLDPGTAEPVWHAPLAGVDIRKWLPGEQWDSGRSAYRVPAAGHPSSGSAGLPDHLKQGRYIIALAILDRQGGMLPSARFATTNYFKGGWHPMGIIGIGETPPDFALDGADFDSPAFDDSLRYLVPANLRSVETPAAPAVKRVSPWKSDPKIELINPHRYWTISEGGRNVEKQILHEDGRVIRVTGEFGDRTRLQYAFGNGIKLDPGRYQLTFRARGTPGQDVEFELADDWRGVSIEDRFVLTGEWTDHRIDFGIKTGFRDSTTLRFNLPKDAAGIFDLARPRLKKLD